MTKTLVDVSPPEPTEPPAASSGPSGEELEAARELVRVARAKGIALTGPDGAAQGTDEDGDRDRARGGDERAPRLRQARTGWSEPG
jgi:hypothetical protein